MIKEVKEVEVKEKEVKVIENTVSNYFKEKIGFKVLSTIEVDNTENKNLLYNISVAYTDITVLMNELGVLNLNNNLLSKFEFKKEWLKSNKEKVNKNSIKYLIEFFNTEKSIYEKEARKFFESYNHILNKEYDLKGILDKLDITILDNDNILLNFFYNVDDKVIIDLLGKIENDKQFLVLLDKELESSVNEFENKYFTVANRNSCMKDGGCYQFYNDTEIEFFPCLVINKQGKIEGRIIYIKEYDLFINGYRNNIGSYKWLSLLERYYNNSSLNYKCHCQGYNNGYRFYIDFIISENNNEADLFLNEFYNLCCYDCGENIDEDEAYYSDDTEEHYCESCFFDTHNYCNTCGEYRHRHYHTMIYIPSYEIIVCDYEHIS